MSEAGDYSPSGWGGAHDFDDARKSYRSHAVGSLDKAIGRGITAKDLVPENLSTESENPIVIIVDETGSIDVRHTSSSLQEEMRCCDDPDQIRRQKQMGEWLATIFSKLPYLEHEAKTEYMGEDVEISFGAIGDAYNDESYPLQARHFVKGADLPKKLEELVIEGSGGGTTQESYELAALYYARNVKMPNAIRPLFIFIGDESPYDYVYSEQAGDYAHVSMAQKVKTSEIFEELKQRFSVYFIQKPYGSEHLSDGPLTGTTKRVHGDWVALVGEDHIALLGDPGRVVDVIFGIMAREAGKIPYFKKEIEERQKLGQIKSAYTALHTIHALPSAKTSTKKALGSGHSVTRRTAGDRDDGF
jgi:hypothetical protein